MSSPRNPSRKIEIIFREGMIGQFRLECVPINTTIEHLLTFGPNHDEYLRVGIMGSQNGRQSKDWVWIIDRKQTLEHYINICQINSNEEVTVCFFK